MAGKKVSKQTKKFTKNHLTHALTVRKKQQSKKKEIDNRKRQRTLKSGHTGKSGSKDKSGNRPTQADSDDDSVTETAPKLDMSVEALLNAKGLESDNTDSSDGSGSEDEDDDDDLDSLESLEGEPNPVMDLKMLKEKDPGFYKYLQENDKELLDFNANELESERDDEELPEGSTSPGRALEEDKPEQDRSVVMTKELLRSWQKAILENRSMRATRKLLLAFKSAAFSADETATNLPFSIESSSVFNAVVITTLRYLPVFLNQSLPAEELSSGKFKIATHTKTYSSIQRLLKSYFASLLELVAQLPSRPRQDESCTQPSMLHTAISESAKLTPWIIGNRKIVRTWTKALLELWASSADQVRVAAIFALRRLAIASGNSESIKKGLYTNLIRSAKSTTPFTVSNINLMKNSASQVYLINFQTSYPIIFGYIRQLAIHLRNSMKLKSKEGFQAVYNWQFIHSLDFWSLVLSEACSNTSWSTREDSALQPLIYPLVQITTGVIKLIPTSRYYPLRFHCIRLLMRLTRRTKTFIPLAPFLLETIDSPLFKRRPKVTTLEPLDWEYVIRCPKSHENTRVYADGVAEESVYLLLNHYASLCKSIAFPELVLPGLVMMKRFSKQYKNQKLVGQLRTLLEKLEANKTWIETRRAGLSFSPRSRKEVDNFLNDVDADKTPLGAYFRLQSKIRTRKRAASFDKSARREVEMTE